MSQQQASGSSRFSFATGANATYIETLYDLYKSDPKQVDASWQRFFEGYELALSGDLLPGSAAPGASASGDAQEASDNAKVEAIINAYRRLGHLSAHLNPLAEKPEIGPHMQPEAHGLKGIAPNRKFHPSNLPHKELTLPEVMKLLTETYCGTIGADFREINDIGIVTWFQDQMESCRNSPVFSPELKKRVLHKLTEAEGFEQFLGKRYIGAKRFSLEGSDALIPMLDIIASDASSAGVEEMCLGMAHRGRLNVLANFMGKNPELILKEFEGADYNPFDIDGDVKYHMGFASEVETWDHKRIRLYLSPNPSHLEIVSPVVEGFVRARQRLLGDQELKRVMPVLMHGDAAFIGQGVSAETLNLSQLDHYKTGGTIHIIINNQIGFTTEPNESRSCAYSSDIAKIIRAPVLHVNADDPEATVWCARLAVAYRQAFQRDIVIDMIGYRRHGHNEGDEPAFTQPIMYKNIATHPTTLTVYKQRLMAEGLVTEADAKAMADEFAAFMQVGYEAVHGKKSPQLKAPVIPVSLQKSMTYKKATREEVAESVKTGVPLKKLRDIAQKITTLPKGFTPHPKLVRLLDARSKMLGDDGAVDWGFGELLALGSLAVEGRHVRLTGQDSQRGTFTSRHSVLVDFENGKRCELLSQLDLKQAPVHIINSPLSELGCLGFEFGYSVADPEALVAWEAQFGDFSNGAQILIDQFLSASEAKWKQTSSLILLLPHGHEGQGPEHSSARPERYLQLCGNLNMQVAIPTTPAQHFHILRRQLHRDFRKPLVIMTPKSLLRHPECVSKPEEFEKNCFQEVLDDQVVPVKERANVERIVACSGKIYYELSKARRENADFAGVPIVRLEQLYPFPYGRMEQLLATYPKLKEIIWTQEEPQNMGGWNFVRGRFLETLAGTQKLTYVGRKNSGTPAEGSAKAHEAEQQRILKDALSLARGMTVEKRAVAGK